MNIRPLILLKWMMTLVLISQSLPARLLSGPELTIQGPRGEKARLAIESLEIDTFLYQDLAETTVTVTFRNPESRMIEGEFAMPLPAGATVSSYALDVNGNMREGVVVEKDRARNAYESIKRQMIDPGFVEREAGNVYRTKIFPIPAKGTKAVRLGYCEILPSNEQSVQYTLPLPAEVLIKKFSATITHGEGSIFEVAPLGNLKHRKKAHRQLEISNDNVKLGKALSISSKKPAESVVIDAGDYSYLRGALDMELLTPMKRTMKSIDLFWDASESGRLRDHAKEFELLAQFFKSHPNIDVHLSFFHLFKESAGAFQIRNGKWDKLKKALSSMLYDGATDFSAITPKADLALVFSDGRNTLHPAPDSKTPILLINSTPSSHSNLASSTGCDQLINLHSEKITDALKLIVNESARIEREQPGDRQEDTIRLFQSQEVPKGLTYLRDSLSPQIVSIPSITSDSERARDLIRKLWAQRKLQSLEQSPVPNTGAIIAHCQQHGLVSNETSFIVLERFEDHLTYEIPPPEPDLRKKYELALEERKGRTTNRLLGRWNRRKAWHETNYPWQDHVLTNPIRHIEIWHNALTKVFKQEELDQDAVATITRWKDEAIATKKQRLELTDADSYHQWLEKVERLQKEQKAHQTLEAKVPAKAQTMAISIRGLVNKPDTYEVSKDLTFLKSFAVAGGANSLGSTNFVVLYRNGTKVIHNTRSEDFKDFKLRPGDMVVIKKLNWLDPGYDGDADPFGEDDNHDRVNPSNLPAVITEESNFYPRTLGSGDGGAGGEPFGDPSISNKLSGTLILPRNEPSLPDVLATFEKSLNSGADPLAAYTSLRKGNRYDDDFYLTASSLLQKHKASELAKRVLSNLIEEQKPRAASYRKWAFSLARSGNIKRASEVLKFAARLIPDDPLLNLDQAWLAGKLDPENTVASTSLLAMALNSSDSRLGEIITADLNQSSEGREHLPLASLEAKLPVDLRIVVTNSSGLRPGYVVTDPANCKSMSHFYTGSGGTVGGRMIQSDGIGEYMIRDAMPGQYRLTLTSPESDLLRVEIYRNWETSDQTKEEFSVPFKGSTKQQEVFAYELQFEANQE